MRAVNLIPADARVGGGPSAGRSGGAVYALLGGLTVLVLLVAVWATTSGKVSDQRSELAQIQADVAQVQARAGALESPGAVQQERLARTETVRSLAAQRTDWAERLDAISRTLPSDVTLDKLTATNAPATTAAPVDPTGAVPGPTVHLEGCAPSQQAVARLMPRLRTVPESTGVKLLSSSSKEAGPSGGSAAAGPVCGGTKFVMDLAFAGAAPTATAAPAAGGATPAAAAPAPAPQTATTAVPGTPDAGTTGATQ